MIKRPKFLLKQPTCLNHHSTLSTMSLFPAASLFPTIAHIPNVLNLLPPFPMFIVSCLYFQLLFLAMVGNKEWLRIGMGATRIQ